MLGAVHRSREEREGELGDAAGASSADTAKASDEAKTSDGVAKDDAASSASGDISAEQKTA